MLTTTRRLSASTCRNYGTTFRFENDRFAAGLCRIRRRGALTEKVRQAVFTVLFDEIEKAHPEVFNILLSA